MSVAEKLKQIAENEQKVYEAGKKKGAESDRATVWDIIQDYGNRTNYSSAFAFTAWDDTSFAPRYDIKPIGECGSLFRGSQIVDLDSTLKRCGVVLDTSEATTLNNALGSRRLEVVPTIDMTSISSSTGANLNIQPEMRTIRKIICAESMPWAPSCFRYASGLINLFIEGVIGSDVTLQYSKLLSKESITSVVNALSDTATGKTLALSETAVNNAFPAKNISIYPFYEPIPTDTDGFMTDNGDGSFTLNGSGWDYDTMTQKPSFTVAKFPITKGEVYEFSSSATNSENSLAHFVVGIIDSEGIDHGMWEQRLNETCTMTADDDGLYIIIHFEHMMQEYNNVTITPSVKKLEWESLTATKPNWTISLV